MRRYGSEHSRRLLDRALEPLLWHDHRPNYTHRLFENSGQPTMPLEHNPNRCGSRRVGAGAQQRTRDKIPLPPGRTSPPSTALEFPRSCLAQHSYFNTSLQSIFWGLETTAKFQTQYLATDFWDGPNGLGPTFFSPRRGQLFLQVSHRLLVNRLTHLKRLAHGVICSE